MKRIIAVAILTLATLSAVAAPRRPSAPPSAPAQGAQPRHGGELLPPQLLADFLDLGEAQITQIGQLRETLRTTVEPLREQQRANGEQLRAAVEAGDAAKAGQLMIANHRLAEQIKAAHDAFQTSFENVLTAAQKAKLAVYKEIVELRSRA